MEQFSLFSVSAEMDRENKDETEQFFQMII